MPELHAISKGFHHGGHIGTALGKPIRVKLKVDGVGLGLSQQDVIPALFALHPLQFAVVVVVEQPHPLLHQRRAGFVQAFCQVVPGGCVGVSKAVHAGDDHIVCAKTLCLGCDGRGVPLDAAEIGVQADDRKSRFPHEFVPVQFAAVAGGHTGGAGQQPHHEPGGVDHKPAELNTGVPGILEGGQRLPGLGFIVEGVAQHELLYAGLDHGEASFL